MKNQSPPPMGPCLIRLHAEEISKQHNCPIYAGRGNIKESDSPYVVVIPPDKSSVFLILREHLKDGVPDDVDVLWEMAALGELYEA